MDCAGTLFHFFLTVDFVACQIARRKGFQRLDAIELEPTQCSISVPWGQGGRKIVPENSRLWQHPHASTRDHGSEGIVKNTVGSNSGGGAPKNDVVLPPGTFQG